MGRFPCAQMEFEIEPHHVEAPRAWNWRDEDLAVANSFDRVSRALEERDQVAQVLLIVDLDLHSRSR
jgi:hypothetical protein